MKQKQQHIKDVSTVRILMLGDKGVGKTSLTNLLASSAITPTPASRTVGEGLWNVQVRLHEYSISVSLPPTPTWTSSSSSERSGKHSPYPRRMPNSVASGGILYFVEFYDLNSEMRMRREHRDSFYKNIDGIVLVYNLQDLRSQDSLHDWLYEPLRQICKYRHRRTRPILGRQHVPILVVGTRLDKLIRRPLRRGGSIAHQLEADEILLNCQDSESFADRSRNEGKLRDFLDRVVEFKEHFPISKSHDT
ncbi:rab-like protein 3 [Drosophila elegans]|uniref:rab-like protein 3 n=1 Tax=Drosophila elegans TaxID=30023 RepID=UPI0007E637ED|nr:rab-like protein 3 [Drosophila elegans]